MTSMAPGQLGTPLALLDAATLEAASDEQLADTVAAVLAVQHRRALAFGDLDALVEQAFIDGFTAHGEACPPWLAGGLLFCPGHKRDRSKTSHDCCFVSVDGEWAWERSTVADVMRQLPGPKAHRQSITVLFVEEGTKLDMVESSARSGGACQMKKARSFQVRNGALVEVAARARKPAGHR